MHRRLLRFLAIALVAAVPFIVSVVVLQSTASVPIMNFVPTWTDEVNYWHQALTFQAVAFGGGYYTFNELPPPATFTRYFTHGPWYPMLYGGLARIVGWETYTAIFINAALIAVAVLVYCYTVKANRRQLAAAALIMATFWPYHIYLFSNMQESLHQVFSILLAVVFFRVLVHRDSVSTRERIVYLLLLAAAAITRISWGVLFLPFFMLLSRQTWRGRLLALLQSAFFLVLAYTVAQLVGAPGDNSITNILAGFSISPGAGLQALAAKFIANLERYFDPAKASLDIVLTVQVVGFILFFVAATLFRRERGQAVESAFHAYNLAAVLFASLALYLIATWGDYRVLATHLMLSLLIMVARQHYRPVLSVIVINALCIGLFVSTFREMVVPKFTTSSDERLAFQEAIRSHAAFDAGAANPWCNTVLFQVTTYNNLLMGFPAGFGLSLFDNPNEPVLQFKSRYLLLSWDAAWYIAQRPDAPLLEILVSTPTANLYRNLRVMDCSN